MKDCDFLVVGGGPAGTTFASAVGKRARVILVEEHETIGIPVQCTGLVSPRVVEMARADGTVLNRLHGAYFHFPGEQTVEVRSKRVKAMVVDRATFDQVGARRAEEAGAEIVLGEKFLSASLEPQVVAKCHGSHHFHEYRAKLLVGADGYKSNVAKCAGLGQAKDYVRGVQMDLDYEEEEQDMLHVYLGRKVAPGFFAWRIPCGDMTRVGLCSSMNNEAPLVYLNHLLERLELKDKRRRSATSGLIPIGPPPRTYASRALVLGDAAGQAKPLSGGGVYTSIVAAGCAAMTALSCLEAEDFGAVALSSYQDRWKAEMGRELDRAFLVRKAYLKLSDRKLEEIGRLLSKPETREVLAQGDIDFPAALAPQVLRNSPGLLKLTPSFLSVLFMRRGARNDI